MSGALRLLQWFHCRPSLRSTYHLLTPSIQNLQINVLRKQSTLKTAGLLLNRPFDVNTNIVKDVILFKHENPRYYKTMNIFAISQFIFWSYLSVLSFTTLRDAPVEPPADGKTQPWYERINLGENKYRNGITITTFLIGYGLLFLAWTFTLKSVRYLILHKGGKDVSFVTYTPFGANRIMKVPLTHISAQESRISAKSQLPIKVKNRWLFYMLDMRGEFKNPQLYDYTAGLKRSF